MENNISARYAATNSNGLMIGAYKYEDGIIGSKQKGELCRKTEANEFYESQSYYYYKELDYNPNSHYGTKEDIHAKLNEFMQSVEHLPSYHWLGSRKNGPCMMELAQEELKSINIKIDDNPRKSFCLETYYDKRNELAFSALHTEPSTQSAIHYLINCTDALLYDSKVLRNSKGVVLSFIEYEDGSEIETLSAWKISQEFTEFQNYKGALKNPQNKMFVNNQKQLALDEAQQNIVGNKQDEQFHNIIERAKQETKTPRPRP